MPTLKNNRHEKYATDLFEGKIQYVAYKETFDCTKLTRATINSNASRLSKNADIQARVRELHQAAESEAVMTVQRRKERLSEIAEARISDFVSCDEHGTHINIGLESAHSAAIQEIKTRKEYSDKGATEAEMTRLKLHDPVRSIAELNKMEGEYPTIKVDIDFGKPFKELLERLRGNHRPELPPGEAVKPKS